MPEELQQQSQGGQETVEVSEFESLLQQEFKPKSNEASKAVQNAVQTLAAQALSRANLVSDDALKSIESIISEIDKKLSEQVNAIIHNEEFQQLESAWRGLHYLVNNTQTDETLKIRVFNISKKELYKTLKKYKGTAWDQSPIFKKMYEDEYGTPGGEPYGSLIGDFYFNHSAVDLEILKGMAQISAAAHSPFLSAADPSIMNLDS
jgi:type VI secretion system protein ImpC